MERVSFLSSGDVSQNPWKASIEPEGLMMNVLLTGCSKHANLAWGAGKWKWNFICECTPKNRKKHTTGLFIFHLNIEAHHHILVFIFKMKSKAFPSRTRNFKMDLRLPPQKSTPFKHKHTIRWRYREDNQMDPVEQFEQIRGILMHGVFGDVSLFGPKPLHVSWSSLIATSGSMVCSIRGCPENMLKVMVGNNILINVYIHIVNIYNTYLHIYVYLSKNMMCMYIYIYVTCILVEIIIYLLLI